MRVGCGLFVEGKAKQTFMKRSVVLRAVETTIVSREQFAIGV